MTAQAADPTKINAEAVNQEAINRLKDASKRLSNLAVTLGAGRAQYEAAANEATEKFGTADLTELRARIRQTSEENQQTALANLAAVDNLEKVLAQLEEALTNPAALAEMLANLPEAPAAITPESVSVPAAAAAAPTKPFNELDI